MLDSRKCGRDICQKQNSIRPTNPAFPICPGLCRYTPDLIPEETIPFLWIDFWPCRKIGLFSRIFLLIVLTQLLSAAFFLHRCSSFIRLTSHPDAGAFLLSSISQSLIQSQFFKPCGKLRYHSAPPLYAQLTI